MGHSTCTLTQAPAERYGLSSSVARHRIFTELSIKIKTRPVIIPKIQNLFLHSRQLRIKFIASAFESRLPRVNDGGIQPTRKGMFFMKLSSDHLILSFLSFKPFSRLAIPFYFQFILF